MADDNFDTETEINLKLESKQEFNSKSMLQQSKKINQSVQRRKKEQICKGTSYIDKIKVIMDGEADSFSDENLIDKKPNVPNSQQLDEEEKARKSRQSARDTRKRRKIYMQLLEKKVVSLSEELDQMKSKTLILESKVQAHQNSEIMNKVQNERKKLFDKLENAIKSGEELEITCIMDSLRLRLGLAGKTRLQALQSIFQEAVNMMMPFHMKYLFWIANNNLDIFREDLDSDSVDSANWFSNIGIQESEIREIQRDILRQKQVYDDILIGLNNIRRVILQQNEKSQDFIDHLRNTFPTINTAKFLLDLDRKRGNYISDKIYPEQFWTDLIENDQVQQQKMQLEKPQMSSPKDQSAKDEIQVQQYGHNSADISFNNECQNTKQNLKKSYSNTMINNMNQQAGQNLVIDTNIINNNLTLSHNNSINQNGYNNMVPNSNQNLSNNSNYNNNNGFNQNSDNLYFNNNNSFDYSKRLEDGTKNEKDFLWYKEYN